jgi:amino acid transporter
MKLNIRTGEGRALIMLMVLLALLILYCFWYIVLPICAIVFVWRKTHLEKRRKWYATITILGIVAIFASIQLYLNRPPTIIITEPQDNITVQESTIEIKGSIIPQNTTLKINGKTVNTDKGNISYSVVLSEGENKIKILGGTWFKKEVNLTIKRELTDAEKEAKIQAEAKAKKAKAEAEAKAKAEQEAWERSKAGQICKEYPVWTKVECQNIADEKIWIGMTKDQATESWGKPHEINRTVYSSGVHEQWVMFDSIYTPYLYFENGILTSWQD